MSTERSCPHCAQRFEGPAAGSGEAVHCPGCGKPVPDLAEEAVDRPTVFGAPPSGALPSPTYVFLSPPQGPDEIGWLGTYRVVRLLGKGGMGMVFEAIDTELHRRVALKVMNPETSRDPEFRDRFMREARTMAAIRSDNIVTIHQVGERNGVLFLAMELLPGEPLDRFMKARGRVPTLDVLRIGADIARGLAAAHAEGHIHRDVKPANIWLEGPGRRVKILDFGLTRPSSGDVKLTQAGLVLGTPGYMAPEQAAGAPFDERCDLFSLGCVLHEMVSGSVTFPGNTPMTVLTAVALHEPPPLDQIDSEVPPALANLVAALLRKNPLERPSSAREIAETLDAMRMEAEGKSLSGTATSRLKPWKRKVGRGRLGTVAAVVGAAVLLLGGLFGASLFKRNDEEPSSAAVVPFSAAQGVTDSEIVLGMSAAFSGPNRELGRAMQTGILSYVESVNEHGGVLGRKLRLVALDDGYEPARALANMEELDQKNKVFAFIGNVGTPTAEVTMPYAAGRKMLFFGAFTGTGLLRDDPPNRYVFNYRASYAQETESIVRYLIDVRQLQPAEIAVFAQQDGYGDSGFEGVARALRKKSWPKEKILRVGYARNTVEVAAAVQAILAQPDLRAVVMVATYRPAAKFVEEIRDAGRGDLILANVSFVNSKALADELLEAGSQYVERLIVTEVVPHPGAGSSIALEAEERIRKYQPAEQLTFTSLEGYVATAILVRGLEQVEQELSTETLVEALESMQEFDLGLGTKLSYGPSDHQASDRVWGTELDQTGQARALRDMDD